jgi:RNA polymerase sigma-70 factor (ECF subfamily)
VRSLWTTVLSALAPSDDEDADPLETIDVADQSQTGANPQKQLEQSQVLALIEKEIEKLPPRQREAFLMRYWEDMDIAETALAMGCSEGSVKTHCSRATHALASALAARGIKL